MFSRLVLIVSILAAAAGFGHADDGEHHDAAPFGVWLTENNESHIEIFRCGEAMCGRVTWMDAVHDEDGNLLTDVNNPDPARRAEPILGLVIMWNITPSDESEGRWEGQVYNPRNGKVYDISLIVKSQSQIIIEGCGLYGLVCQQQEWQRVGS